MNNTEKMESLEYLIQQSSSVKVEKYTDHNFEVWKNLVDRTLMKVFGEKSPQYSHFKKLKFYQKTLAYRTDSFQPEKIAEREARSLEYFRRDFKILINSVNQYIAEFKPTNNNG